MVSRDNPNMCVSPAQIEDTPQVASISPLGTGLDEAIRRSHAYFRRSQYPEPDPAPIPLRFSHVAAPPRHLDPGVLEPSSYRRIPVHELTAGSVRRGRHLGLPSRTLDPSVARYGPAGDGMIVNRACESKTKITMSGRPTADPPGAKLSQFARYGDARCAD